MFFFFFFQAEDGIRDLTVTGVQTCALPISIAASSLATATARGLSAFFTVRKTLPWVGSVTPAPSWLLTKASPKVLPTPMTSPVDFISEIGRASCRERV